MDEPWETITIEQKLRFEEELQKEIKKKPSSFFGLIKSTGKHILADYECSAVCKSVQADDILFSIHNKNGSDKIYALVHFTFRGKTKENPLWPSTTLFASFDNFKFEKMYPDKAEWEH